jgi:phage protein D
MPEGEFSVLPRVQVGGADLDEALRPLLEQVVVDDHLHLPDMFVLTFRDTSRDVLSRAHVEIGTRVRVSTSAPGGGRPELLVAGEVTALEAEYDQGGSRVVVRGYDESHRLHAGRHTESYRNVRDSDIARTIASRAGLPAGTIDDSRMTHQHVSQVNLSDWDFLKARAREIGFELAVADGHLHFRRPARSEHAPGAGDYQSADPLQLVFGQDLLEFRPRVSCAQQVKGVVVRGWDSRSKRAMIGTAPAATISAELPLGPSTLARRAGDRTYVAADRPLATQGEVDTAAGAVAEQIGSAFAEADGVARGNPRLRAGAAISVSIVAEDFAGRYTLTHTRHVFDSVNGYLTWFEISGRQDRSILGLVSLGATNGAPSAGGPPVYGVVIGQVTNVKDPDDLGRVRLRFPWLSDDYESDWVRMTQFGAGKGNGSLFLPEVEDEVLVAFEFGDVRRPYVVGCLYNGVDRPADAEQAIDGSSGAVRRRTFRSRRGHVVTFSDQDGQEGIRLETDGGKTSVVLDHTGTAIAVHSDGDVTVDARGSCHVKAASAVTIEGQSKVEIKAAGGVTIDGGSGVVEIKGSLIKLN